MNWREVKSESDFYALLRELTAGRIYYERVEPRTESGFPDIYFVLRAPVRGLREGTMELKYFSAREAVDLSTSKFRGNQKAALLEYHAAGGKRRFVLAFRDGIVYAWETGPAAAAVMGKPNLHESYPLDGNENRFAIWLTEILR